MIKDVLVQSIVYYNKGYLPTIEPTITYYNLVFFILNIFHRFYFMLKSSSERSLVKTDNFHSYLKIKSLVFQKTIL